ncbi:MAG: hypothetical protein QNJ78_05815 [Gammaproteobacteria bacterium]|nr:hypothetical protein [Gammaproteobacteria bacterium]
MAIRIKSHWHDEDSDRSPKEIGGALAFIAWKIALDKAITLHGKNFVYANDRQRLGVIAEYLAFEVQIVDRTIHGMLDNAARVDLITALVMRLAEHFEDNALELLGPGEHANQFISLFNERSGDYAEFNFTEEGPSYPFFRHLGFEIQQIMGAEQENRWVIDQVMDVDGPEVYKQLARAVRNLLD